MRGGEKQQRLRENFHRALGRSPRECGVELSDLDDSKSAVFDFDTSQSLESEQNSQLRLTRSLEPLAFFCSHRGNNPNN